METFEVEKFRGTWYVVRKYPYWLTVGSSCTAIVFDTIGDNTTVTGEVLQRRFGEQMSTLVVTKSTKHGFRTLRLPGVHSCK